MAITSELVKQLREMTGAGMMDCKKALEEASGSIDGAVEALRKKGLKDVAKRAGKVAAEGTVSMYMHPGDQIGVMLELNCETDFVARGDVFKEAARGIALHIAAMKPQYVSAEEVPQELLKKEEEIYLAQLNDAQKAKADKIIPGKIENFLAEVVLLKQPYIKDDSGKKSVKDIVDELSIKCGEKVTIRRFIRFEVGEGIEKAATNFADEVAAMVTN